MSKLSKRSHDNDWGDSSDEENIRGFKHLCVIGVDEMKDDTDKVTGDAMDKVKKNEKENEKRTHDEIEGTGGEEGETSPKRNKTSSLPSDLYMRFEHCLPNIWRMVTNHRNVPCLPMLLAFMSRNNIQTLSGENATWRNMAILWNVYISSK